MRCFDHVSTMIDDVYKVGMNTCNLLLIVSPYECTYGGYYGLVVVTPRPQIFHRSHDNLKNPYRIACIFYM